MNSINYLRRLPALCFAAYFGLIAVIGRCAKETLKFQVRSNSMFPTFTAGQIVEAYPFRGKSSGLKRYDIVAFHPPFNDTEVFAFRIVGLPGESIVVKSNGLELNGRLIPRQDLPPVLRRTGSWLPGRSSITNATWHLKPGEVFVVGDNLNDANDSRFWGGLPIMRIIGTIDQLK